MMFNGGANVNIISGADLTHFLMRGDTDVISLLINQGVDFNQCQRGRYKYTAEDEAEAKQLLIENGYDPSNAAEIVKKWRSK